MVVVGISQVRNDWWVHFYDPGLLDPDWKKIHRSKLADFAAVVEEWWVPD